MNSKGNINKMKKVIKGILIALGLIFVFGLVGAVLNPVNDSTKQEVIQEVKQEITDEIVYKTTQEIYKKYEAEIYENEKKVFGEYGAKTIEDMTKIQDEIEEAEQRAIKETAEKFNITPEEVEKKCLDYIKVLD